MGGLQGVLFNMNGLKQRLAIAVCTIAMLSVNGVSADSSDVDIILDAINQFSDAVVDGDVSSILDLVPESGIYDGDAHYTKEMISDRLMDKESHLYESLFDETPIECRMPNVPFSVSGKTYFSNVPDDFDVAINYNSRLERYSVVVPKIEVSSCLIWLFYMAMTVEEGKAYFASYFFL